MGRSTGGPGCTCCSLGWRASALVAARVLRNRRSGGRHARHLQSDLLPRIPRTGRLYLQPMVETIQWTAAGVVMIDQTRLPREEVYVTCRTTRRWPRRFVDMVIRGAPAIGVAAAMGVAIGVQQADPAAMDEAMERICTRWRRRGRRRSICSGRIDRMKRLYASLRGRPVEEIRARADRRSAADHARRHRHQPGDRPPRRAAGAGRQDGADALQRGRAGDGGLRHGAGRDSRGGRRRARRSTCSPTRRGRFCRARG